jgi:hypothetical protein
MKRNREPGGVNKPFCRLFALQRLGGQFSLLFFLLVLLLELWIDKDTNPVASF